jgi:spore coat protein U-like protein
MLALALTALSVDTRAQTMAHRPRIGGAHPRFVFGCTVTATPMNFGVYDVFALAPLNATSSVTTQCSNFFGTSQVVLSFSQGSSGSYFPRTMKNGTNALTYNLYRSAARTRVLGNGNNGTVTITFSPTCPSFFIGNCNPYQVTVYGRISANQNVIPGNYTDTITVTATF